MSFLLKTARLPVTTRLVFTQSPARFSTSTLLRKDVVDQVKDAAKAVDQTVSQGAIKGIDLGAAAAQKVKETVGVESGKAQGEAQELAGQAKGKASELAGQAKGKAAELKGEAKSKL